jgi:uncharacterized membrane protein
MCFLISSAKLLKIVAIHDFVDNKIFQACLFLLLRTLKTNIIGGYGRSNSIVGGYGIPAVANND